MTEIIKHVVDCTLQYPTLTSQGGVEEFCEDMDVPGTFNKSARLRWAWGRWSCKLSNSCLNHSKFQTDQEEVNELRITNCMLGNTINSGVCQYWVPKTSDSGDGYRRCEVRRCSNRNTSGDQENNWRLR